METKDVVYVALRLLEISIMLVMATFLRHSFNRLKELIALLKIGTIAPGMNKSAQTALTSAVLESGTEEELPTARQLLATLQDSQISGLSRRP